MKYSTCDLYFAAALQSKGLVMSGTDIRVGRVYFVFEDAERVSPVEREYLMHNCHVEVSHYISIIKDLKRLCGNLLGTQQGMGK